MKSRKKNNNNLHDLQTGRINTLMCQSFSDVSRENGVQSMCYQKIYIKVYLMHKTNHA